MIRFRWPLRLTVIACLVLFCWGGIASAISAVPDHVTLTWTGDPRTTQTITWRTDVSVGTGQLRLEEALGNAASILPGVRLTAETTSLETEFGEMNLHSATVTGLKPGTRYRYQVGAGEAWSEVRQFTTAPRSASTFSFLIFGDSQSRDYGVWRTTLQQAVLANPGVAFFVSMGDLVDVGQDYEEWEAWFEASAEALEVLPIMPLTGNHECYTPERIFSQPRYFTAQFALPDNGPAGLKRQVYSFDYGDIHFVMLDSQAGEQREFMPDLLERQRQWLARDLAVTDKKWKVAFIHRPLYGNKPNGVNENLRRAFAPVFDEYKVDLVFTAHDHVIARTLPIADDAAVAPPEFGTVYAATGRSGTKTYDNVAAKDWNVFFYNPVEEPNYLLVKVNGNTLQVQAITASGAVVDEWSVEKKEQQQVGRQGAGM